MNIRTDSLETTLRRLDQIQQGQNTPASLKGAPQGFAAVFAEELGTPNETDALTSGTLSSGMIDPALFVSALDGNEEGSSELFSDDFTGQASGLLNSWEQYANTLTNGTPRAAWSALNGMDAQLQALRGSLSTLNRPNSGLESVVNELEVLSATEKFKFNRGDYI